MKIRYIIVFVSVIIAILITTALHFSPPAGVSGRSTSTESSIQLSVQPTSSLSFPASSVYWGSVETKSNMPCDLYTLGAGISNSSGGCSYIENPGPQPISLMNNGNSNLRVMLISNKNASTLLGGNGTSARFRYIVLQSDRGEICDDPTNKDFIDVSSIFYTTVCNNLKAEDADDEINIGFYLLIPSDVFSGNKTSTVTLEATTI